MSRSKRRYGLAILLAALGSLLLAASASAATVVNGDFETGNLEGWQQYSATHSSDWFTYTQEDFEEPGGELTYFPPPSGKYAATEDQHNPDITALYQDIALEPGATHQLALTFYYASDAPLFVPDPNTLSLGEENQQIRVDVMKPTAPIESVEPGDILATLWASKNGDSEFLPPTRLTADLTPFAGQTVRLRIVSSVTRAPMLGGVDAVSITSSAPPPPPPSNLITKGKLTLNKKKGTGKLAITVPGAGTLQVKNKGKKLIKTQNLTSTGPATLKVALIPTAKGRKILKQKGKLKLQLQATFTPTGGTAATQTYKVTLKKTLKG
jgi:hypothetical protein